MKGLVLSSVVALGLGAFAAGSANAVPLATHDAILAPAATTDVGCRTVKTITYDRGVKRVVTRQQCDGPRVVERRVYRDGPGYYHRHDRPGVRIGIGVR